MVVFDESESDNLAEVRTYLAAYFMYIHIINNAYLSMPPLQTGSLHSASTPIMTSDCK